MFVNSVLDYWGRSEEFPLFGGYSACMDFCCSEMLKECEAYDLIMNDAPPRSVPKSKPSPRIAKMVQLREELEYDLIRNDAAPPSLPTPKPKQPKRIKKDCPFEIQILLAKNGGDSVVLMSPDEETPHLETKVVDLLEACYLNNNVSSMELQVCACPLPAKSARADAAFDFAREFLLGFCLWPFTASMT